MADPVFENVPTAHLSSGKWAVSSGMRCDTFLRVCSSEIQLLWLSFFAKPNGVFLRHKTS